VGGNSFDFSTYDPHSTHTQIIATLDTSHCALSIYSFISLNRRDYVDLTEPIDGTGRTGYNV